MVEPNEVDDKVDVDGCEGDEVGLAVVKAGPDEVFNKFEAAETAKPELVQGVVGKSMHTVL